MLMRFGRGQISFDGRRFQIAETAEEVELVGADPGGDVVDAQRRYSNRTRREVKCGMAGFSAGSTADSIAARICIRHSSGRLPTGFLPDEDQGIMFVVAQLPAGATLRIFHTNARFIRRLICRLILHWWRSNMVMSASAPS